MIRLLSGGAFSGSLYYYKMKQSHIKSVISLHKKNTVFFFFNDCNLDFLVTESSSLVAVQCCDSIVNETSTTYKGARAIEINIKYY